MTIEPHFTSSEDLSLIDDQGVLQDEETRLVFESTDPVDLDQVSWPDPCQVVVFLQTSVRLTSAWPTACREIRLIGCGLKRDDLTGLTFPPTVKILDLSKNRLENLPDIVWPARLKDLDLSGNRLTTFRLTGTVKFLNLADNRLRSIDLNGSRVTYLNGNGNIRPEITFPLSLRHLLIEGCRFSRLPTLPVNLEYLYAGYNRLTTLPVFPVSLLFLSLPFNRLTEVPRLPTNLRYLHASHNRLTTVDLPDQLHEVDLSNNLLEQVPRLPRNIRTFYALFNQINDAKQLGLLQSSTPIDLINLYGNRLTERPPVPSQLRRLNIGANPLPSENV